MNFNLFAIFGLGAQELVLIVLILVLLFGARKIPELARGLGRGINEFKSAANDVQKEIDKESKEVKTSFKEDKKESK